MGEIQKLSEFIIPILKKELVRKKIRVNIRVPQAKSEFQEGRIIEVDALNDRGEIDMITDNQEIYRVRLCDCEGYVVGCPDMHQIARVCKTTEIIIE